MASKPPLGEAQRKSRLQLALERELRGDEAVLWHGWQLGRLDWRKFGIYLFGVPWTAFAVMWTVLAASAVGNMPEGAANAVSWAFPLFGTPFIAVGIGMLALPWLPLYLGGRVLYVVTDKRVLQFSIVRDLTVKTVPADRIGVVERSERRDGSGTLRIAVKIGRDSDGDKQTEFLDLGEVIDVIGAADAVAQIAAAQSPAPLLPSQPALSS